VIRVSYPGTGPVFGLWCEGERVVSAAPVARYAVGWTAIRAVRYFLARGCTVELMTGPHVVKRYSPGEASR